MECNCNAAMQVNSTRSKDREMLVRLVNWSLLSQEVQVWSWSCWKTHNSTSMVWINRWTFSWKPKKCGDPGFPSFLWLLLDHISQLQHDIREPCLAATPLEVWRPLCPAHSCLLYLHFLLPVTSWRPLSLGPLLSPLLTVYAINLNHYTKWCHEASYTSSLQEYFLL